MSQRRHSRAKPPAALSKVFEQIKPLAAEIKRLQKQLQAAGGFANHRELLECPHCKLAEDVTVANILITSHPLTPEVDTGLRFVPADDQEKFWRCPACGRQFPGESRWE